MSIDVLIPGLPLPRTALIGRESDLRTAQAILAADDTRLLTFTGVGGCGKTRLALQLMTDLAPAYPQRTWAVELAAVVDPDLIPLVVAGTLGLQESSSTSSLAAISAYLGDRPALLLLDNCEHLIDACATFVDTLLGVCPELRVIATSRERLHIEGERQFQVSPLDLPDPVEPGSVEEIGASAAVQLFVARSQAVAQDFELTRANAAIVAQICSRLDGIPLALELAAARVRVLGVEQIRTRLDDSFQLLTGGSRIAPTRHQTLRAALAWSDELLSDAEKAVFLRLAVFVGEFQLPAAEALCDDLAGEGGEILDIVTGLVDKSLVVVKRTDGAAWYRLLEPVRQYAYELLEAAGEVRATRERHAAFYLELAEAAEYDLYGPDEVYWLNQIEREHNNFRAALEWARQDPDPRIELRLAAALEPFWNVRGHIVEGLRNLNHALARDGAGDDPFVYARALVHTGKLNFLFEYARDSTFAAAEARSLEGLRIAREIDAAWVTGDALITLGMVYRMHGDLERSSAALAEALVIHDEDGYELGAAYALLNLGISALILGDRDRGTRLLQESLDRLPPKGGLRIKMMAQAVLGSQAGELGRSLALLADTLQNHRRLGDRWFMTWDLMALASVLLGAGYDKHGVRVMSAAQAQSDRLGLALGGVSFEQGIARVDSLRNQDWFDLVWEAGYALDADGAIELVISLRDELATDAPRGEPDKPDFSPLTPRELEVARLLAAGHTDREIADALFIAPGTVGVHVHNILQKLELHSRVQVAVWLTERDFSGASAG